jgi:hypothetical protein
LLGGCPKNFKLEQINEFRGGDKLIRLEFFGTTIVLLNWKLCRGGKGLLSLVYEGANEISFNSKIEGNLIIAMEIEEEQGKNST